MIKNLKFKISNCLILLAGLTLFLLLPRPAVAVNSGQFTMSLWVNPSTSVASKALISKAEEFRIFTNASGYVGAQIKTTTWQTAAQSATRALSLNSWNHVVCTYDLVNLKVYVNGVLAGSTALSTLPDDTANLLKIGQDDSASTTYTNLAGVIDEFKFYNYALTEDEIKTEYNRGSAMVLGTLSNTAGLSGGSIASSSASAAYCIPGDTATCNPPVGEWSFDDGSGLSVADKSGNNNTGTWSGTGITHWTTGKIGKAGKFNGTDDYVNAVNGSPITGSTPFTLEAWVKVGTYRGQFTGAVSIGTNTSAQSAYIGQISSNNLGGGFWGTNYDTGVPPATGIWYHLVETFAGGTNGAVKIYVNGIEKVNQTFTPNISASYARIGVIIVNPYWFNGQIDEVKIFNYARSPAQIAWDYNRGKPVGYWKMDECSGTVAHDSSGNNYNGTLTGGTPGTCSDGTGTTAWNLGVNGKYNSSLKFDGTNYVNEPTSISNAQSVGFWVYPATTSQSFLQLSSTATVTSSGGVVSAGAGFASPTIYINGKVGTTGITANAWNHIVVTTATGITANAIKFGLVGSTYYSGQMDEVKIWNYALTAVQVKMEYNQGSGIRFGPATGSP